MKTTYFRIIELPKHQVLLTKDFDGDDYLLAVCFFMDGVKATLKMSFEDEEDRNTAFDGFTDESAQTFIDESYPMHS